MRVFCCPRVLSGVEGCLCGACRGGGGVFAGGQGRVVVRHRLPEPSAQPQRPARPPGATHARSQVPVPDHHWCVSAQALVMCFVPYPGVRASRLLQRKQVSLLRRMSAFTTCPPQWQSGWTLRLALPGRRRKLRQMHLRLATRVCVFCCKTQAKHSRALSCQTLSAIWEWRLWATGTTFSFQSTRCGCVVCRAYGEDRDL